MRETLEEIAAILEDTAESEEMTEHAKRFLTICAQSIRELAQQVEVTV
jgi:hypothetical protein